ncbi:hypothetical protein [Aliikangiella maris]|uniref:Uncharacterized protein n=2 Tax=Aliikangiella maris TaxID=3162458 RepID=A0ABV3MJD7_9GAMM
MMKNTLLLILLIPFTLTQAAGFKNDKQVRVKNQSEQAKVYRHHQQNWHQPDYSHGTRLFTCYDSWNHHLKGKFTAEQQYFIELGGGRCHPVKRPREQHQLSEFYDYDFPIDNVYRAIDEIKDQYGLRRAKVVRSNNIQSGYKTFRYTLVFKVNGRKYREFRVKHNKRNGNIRHIYEI